MEKNFKKGDKVIVSPTAYPRERWEGEVLSSRKGKYLTKVTVKYDCHGMMLKESFYERELSLI
jgi:hypothetical protein